MTLDVQFVPSYFLSSSGHLVVPEHRGEMPVCQLQRGWNLRQLSSEKISLKVGRSKNLISVNSSDLLDKLKLNSEDVARIRAEEDPSRRALMLKNIVRIKKLLEKQETGILFFKFFSLSEHSDLRRNHLDHFLSQVQPLLDSNLISFSYLTKSFEKILEEYRQNPYENFFPLSERIFDNFSLETNNEELNRWINEIVSKMERMSSPEYSRLIDKLRVIQSSLRPSLPVDEEFSNSSQSVAYKSYLRLFGSDSDILTYLELDGWYTEGNKEEALKRIIESFRKQSRVLDLSSLHLTDLPDDLKNILWIKDLNLSHNAIRNLSALSGLRYLTTLDLSYNSVGGRDGISDFIPLNNLERLRLVKLCFMGGDYRHLMERLRIDLAQCDRIEWVNNWGQERVLARREGELLGAFLRRRERVFCPPVQNFSSAPLVFSSLTLSSAQDNPKDSVIVAGFSEALKRLQIREVDISSLMDKDPNIISWLNRLVVEEGIRGLAIWNDSALRPVLSSKILEVLECAKSSSEFFRDILTPLVATAVTDCGDNSLYYFNEIARRMELFKAKELRVEQALPIFRRYFSVALIKEIAKRSVRERAQSLPADEREYLEKEALGVELDFLIRFKEEFQVPLVLSKGRFIGPEVEKRVSFIDSAKALLRSSLNSNQALIQYLASDPEWRRYLLSHVDSLEGDLRAQESSRDLAIENLENQKDHMTSTAYEQAYFDLMKRDQNQSQAVVANATERLLIEHHLI